jgi:hypothetical protein
MRVIWEESEALQIHVLDFAGKGEVLQEQFAKQILSEIVRPTLRNRRDEVTSPREIDPFLRIPVMMESHSEPEIEESFGGIGE